MRPNRKQAILLLALVALLFALYMPAQACCSEEEPEPPISETSSPELYLPLIAANAVAVMPTPTRSPAQNG